jgi:hypothetical protein
MKKKIGLIVPIAMMLFGSYALFTTLGSDGELVNLIADHQLPRGLALILGLIGLGGGAAVMANSLMAHRHAA